MHPSESEIQREVEALRDIRRRSTAQGGPGALVIDLDLPNQSSPSSPTTSYWTGATPGLTDEDSADSSPENGDGPDESPDDIADDPFHLFWVPASLHPEIAPAEFRAFLKEHARAPATDGTTVLQRSGSTSSIQSGLGRRKSMLSRQYKPSENDGVEEEEVVSIQRNKSIYRNQGPQLTINDLQKLEMLAEEASEHDDPSRLRNILRRSLSLNMSPTAVVDEMERMPDMEDEADSPIIVPPPGQILRRAARTKIRKAGLPGDGGGHRFGASRRTSPRTSGGAIPSHVQRTSTSSSSSEQGDSVDSHQQRPFSGESFDGDDAPGSIRPESFSEETSIYEAYVREDVNSEGLPVVITSPPPLLVDSPTSPLHPEAELAEEQVSPPLHHPQPQKYLSPVQEQQPLARTPSPEEHTPGPTLRSPNQDSPPLAPPGPGQQQQRKDKGGKGLFKWGGDKAAKRNSKDKDQNRDRTDKEKEGGFFGSLFRKKSDDPQSLVQGGTSGRDTARALLGGSGSKSYVPPSSPQLAAGANPYARYPIHVERAIYRLSHIKLANPRRPLYEQVLISNLMFWYLGVINKAQSPATPTPPTPAAATQNNAAEAEKEQKEREQRELEERLKAEKEKERQEKEREAMEQQKKKESTRRGSLTKTLSTGSLGGGRRAEMPIKGPQYDMQHRVMEQEYNGSIGQPSSPAHGPQPLSRPVSAPAGAAAPQLAQYPRMQQLGHPVPQQPSQQAPAQQPAQQLPQTQIPNSNTYYGGMEQQSRGGAMTLPPGAMPPVSTEPSAWLSFPSQRKAKSPPPPGASTSQPPPRRSRSPPPPHLLNSSYRYQTADPPPLPGQSEGKIPSRSLSANPQPSPHVNGKLRKGASASASVPNGKRPKSAEDVGGREDEDVPLAFWQQQRWK